MKQKKILMRIVTVGIARGGQIDFLELNHDEVSHVHLLCLRLAFATTLERCDHIRTPCSRESHVWEPIPDRKRS